MPAPRPVHDAEAIWLIVQAEFGDARGVRDGAFLEIHNRMRKDGGPSRRGVGPSIDCESGHVIGDQLSTYQLKKLYEKAQRLIRRDSALEAEMRSRADQLKTALAQEPGSYLAPLRPRGAEVAETWVIVQFIPAHEQLVFHAARGDLMLREADTPDGPFTEIKGQMRI